MPNRVFGTRISIHVILIYSHSCARLRIRGRLNCAKGVSPYKNDDDDDAAPLRRKEKGRAAAMHFARAAYQTSACNVFVGRRMRFGGTFQSGKAVKGKRTPLCRNNIRLWCKSALSSGSYNFRHNLQFRRHELVALWYLIKAISAYATSLFLIS